MSSFFFTFFPLLMSYLSTLVQWSLLIFQIHTYHINLCFVSDIFYFFIDIMFKNLVLQHILFFFGSKFILKFLDLTFCLHLIKLNLGHFCLNKDLMSFVQSAHFFISLWFQLLERHTKLGLLSHTIGFKNIDVLFNGTFL